MTREEAIEWMEETIQDAEKLLDKCSPELKEEILEQNEVFKIAISALRSTPQPGKPLTLDQLREMDGQPSWCEDIERWALVSVSDAGKWKGVPFALFEKNGGRFEWNIEGRELSLYSYPPARIDRSEWTAEWKGNYRSGVSAGTGFVCSFCDMWNDRKSDFCPHCGKAMTEEAWEKLERRLQRMPLPEPPEEG